MAKRPPAPPRAKGERDPERTRELLIAAAARLFAAHGYDGVSIDEIAREAAVNKAMVSYHFGGKLGLFQAIVRAALEPLAERAATLATVPGDEGELIAAFIGGFGELAAGHPELPAIIVREAVSGGTHLDDELRGRMLAVFGGLARVIARGVERGRFRPVDPLLTHLTIMASLVFFHATEALRTAMFATGRIPGAKPTSEAFVRHLQELVVRGLAADSPRS